MLGKFSTLVDLLRERAQYQPEQTAFIFLPDGETPSGSLTYAELDKRARAIAAQLQAQNAQGERALLLYPPGLEFIAAFFGCLYAGTIAVPAYPPRRGAPLSRLEAVVADAQAKYTLTTRSLFESIQGRFAQNPLLKESLHWLATDNIPSEQAQNWQAPTIGSDNIAFLQYTSGSTGTPKGAVVSHRNLLHNSALISLGFHQDHKIAVSWLPSYHDMGLIGGILQPIYVGVCMVIMPPVTFLQRPLRWLQAISQYQATTSGGPNFAYELCADKVSPKALENLDLSCWRIAFSGAEPIRAETLERFYRTFAPCGFRREAFFSCYGMAETTLIVSGADRDRAPVLKTVDGQALAQNRIIETADETMPTLVSCGHPLGDIQVAIAHPETHEPCTPTEVGEIWVAGDSVVQGYWGRPELTQAVFNAHLSTGEGPFLRTGDLGFLQDGELFVTGRRKDLIIIRGRNHYPQDIEKTVENSHPALRIAWGAAFAVEVDGEERLAIVQEVERRAVRKLKTSEQIAEVTQAIRTRVAQYHELQPYAILLLKTGSIPKTSSGKIQRFACREGFLNNTLDVVGEWRVSHQSITNYQLPITNYQSPTTNNQQLTTNHQQQLQAWLIQQVADQLGIEPGIVDPQQPFAYYGLDSVAAVRLTGELEEWLERSLSPTLAYDYPTIAAMAAYLSGNEEVLRVPSPEEAKPALSQDKIAVVGLGCRFPGAENLEAFWELLTQGQGAIRVGDRPSLHQTPGGFLNQVDLFDPQFFNISPREAERLDPQQRLLLEVAWEALEQGNIAPTSLAGSATGVFIGISSNDYLQLQGRHGVPVDAYAGTGNAHSIAANRLSYFLDLRGPSMAIDTACSSSLVALHLACQSLQVGECELAIAGGVNVILAGDLSETFTQAGMLAPDGVCKTFDAAADGYGRGEGCGVVILKRLSQALQDGDRVWGTIEGTALVQDGRSNGLTAPNGIAQQRVITGALQQAYVTPAQVSYVETHGTGTPLGDPIEINALKAVLLRDRPSDSPCWLGSVKTNIGHLEAAAGMAGLIKTLLALRAGMIPPHQNLTQLNPHIQLEDTPLEIPTTLQPWEVSGKRIAGVSSFGFGGMNAHAIVAQAPEMIVPEPSAFERPLHLLALSAKTPAALSDRLLQLQQYLQTHPQVNLADLCFTANTGRSHFEQRLALIVESTRDLAQQPLSVVPLKNSSTTSPRLKIAFLCTGQGSQYVNMGRELYEREPLFRDIIDDCDAKTQSYLNPSLRSVLYDSSDDSLIDSTIYTQPALFVIEYAIAQLWQSWGVVPDLILGHSVGEYAAACIAGVFSLEDGLKLITERGRLMQALPQTGSMVAVFAPIEVVEAILTQIESGVVTIAALNAPNLHVISGSEAALNDAIAAFSKQKIKTKALNVSHAFHSPLMQPMVAAMRAIAEGIEYHPPRLPFVSNVTGNLVTTEMTTADYWCRHILEPVRFAQSMQVLAEQGCNCFLEIGAKSTLLGMGRQCLPGNGLWLPSLRPDLGDTQQMLSSLKQLYEQGATIDWQGFDRDFPRQKLELPTYPFQRQRYWLPALDAQVPSLGVDCCYQVEWVEFAAGGGCYSESVSSLICCFPTEVDGVQQLVPSLGKCEIVVLGETVSWQELESLTGFLGDRAFTHLIYYNLAPEVSNLDSIQERQKERHQALLHLVQALHHLLTREGKTAPQLWLVTQNTQSLSIEDRVNFADASLWGMGQAIALELPQIWGGMIDLPSEAVSGDAIATAILQAQTEDRLVFRDDSCYVPRLRSYYPQPAATPAIRQDGTYLVTGGLGSLGLKTAQWLIEQGATSIVLTGRDRASAEAKIANLATKDAKITVIAADVSQKADVSQLLQQIAPLPPLRGIIHAAGVLEDGWVTQQNWPQFERVFAPKVAGAWNLHQATLNYELDFWVLFSSIAAVLGSPGQSNYAAANAFLDALARDRVRQGLPTLSVNWSAWGEGGMAQEQNRRFRKMGITPLAPQTAFGALERLLGENTVQSLVIEADWTKLAAAYGQTPALLQDLLPAAPKTSSASAPNWFERLQTAAPNQRESLLQEYLQQQIAQALQLQPKQIAPEQNLLDMGMDSLMLMETINQLRNDLQLLLYPREFYERPRLNALARYIAAEFDRTHNLTDIPVSAVSPTPHLLSTEANSEVIPPLAQKLPPAVFILSSPRAGSTLLRVMLAGHPQLFSPPELHLLPFTSMAQREADLALSGLEGGLVRSLMALYDTDAPSARDLAAEMSRSDLAIPDVYAKLQHAAQPRILVDKSPTYALHRATLDRAEAWFEQPKYIHLVRHPYAAIESFTRLRMDKLMGQDRGNPYILAEQVWHTCNANILDFSQTLEGDRYLLVYYEHLVKQPEKVMRQICQFLGIDWAEAAIDPYEGSRMVDGTEANSLSIGDPNFRDRRQLDPSLADVWQTVKLPRPLGKKAKMLAQQLQYELPGDYSPSHSREIQKAEEFVDAGGQKLCLCTWGKPQQPLILLIHGILEQGAAWGQTAQYLAAAGYRVVAPDLRGHGRSDHALGGSYRLLDFLGDLDALVPQLSDEPLTLVGHSLGAAIAALWAGARGDRVESLVLVEPVLPVESKAHATEQLKIHLDGRQSRSPHPIFPNLEVVAKRLQAVTPSMSATVAYELAQRHTEPFEGGWRWRWDVRLSNRSSLGLGGLPFSRAQYLELLEGIECPITLVYGDRSTFNRPEDLQAQQQAMSQARRIELAGGHNLHIDAPDAIAEIILGVH
ncbi:MAG: hybrid fatty acyl-AMP ligase/type I polyketide synthase [Jaaginema sp. PMC 1079.18]|nr:hybrid fatty acyl-AMP ligase/type I polyketide synthase [Jaaginema sp. PMC 1080.18]MEC4850179.1 hybrid fatty acyl-AMP ligase/type I polyketide synthase [Jaaginema sp. PMC 1079.18]MEC4866776.1 hybrid fatty acyl-AMP ligase/type I polyketide synthase [Jaaginema sp. PMC 1078.18]